MKDWEASNLDNSECLGMIEIPTNLEETEWQLFEMVVTPTKMVRGLLLLSSATKGCKP